MRDYLEYVHAISDAMRQAAEIKKPVDYCSSESSVSSKKSPILMLSPHPDDEMIIGALPLRFHRQCGMRIINVSVTLGSNRQRQKERLAELNAACNYIGFEARTIGERGLEKVNPDIRNDTARWNAAADAIAAVIVETKPSAIFFPHALDGNRTHMGVSLLAYEALKRAGHPCDIFLTEFWAAMTNPNLAVESSEEDVAALISALTFHAGEVSRNPYHLSLPSWMIDNVRRGAELVGTQGGNAPSFTFATLYRHEFWDGHTSAPTCEGNTFLECVKNPLNLLKR